MLLATDATIRVTSWEQLTREQCKQIDAAQPERKRLHTDQLDNLTIIAAMVSWLSDIIEAPHTKKLLKEEGLYAQMKGAVGILKHCKSSIHDHTSALQLRSVAGTWKTAHFTMSTTPVPDYVNVRGDTLRDLTQAACAGCKAELCMKSKAEAAACPRKQALDMVPGIGGLLANADYGMLDACPYSLVE